jgi:hypothetical protein
MAAMTGQRLLRLDEVNLTAPAAEHPQQLVRECGCLLFVREAERSRVVGAARSRRQNEPLALDHQRTSRTQDWLFKEQSPQIRLRARVRPFAPEQPGNLSPFTARCGARAR